MWLPLEDEIKIIELKIDNNKRFNQVFIRRCSVPFFLDCLGQIWKHCCQFLFFSGFSCYCKGPSFWIGFEHKVVGLRQDYLLSEIVRYIGY